MHYINIHSFFSSQGLVQNWTGCRICPSVRQRRLKWSLIPVGPTWERSMRLCPYRFDESNIKYLRQAKKYRMKIKYQLFMPFETVNIHHHNHSLIQTCAKKVQTNKCHDKINKKYKFAFYKCKQNCDILKFSCIIMLIII